MPDPGSPGHEVERIRFVSFFLDVASDIGAGFGRTFANGDYSVFPYRLDDRVGVEGVANWPSSGEEVLAEDDSVVVWPFCPTAIFTA